VSVASISSAIITPALPQIQMQFHLSTDHLEWIISIFMLGYVFGQLIYGPLANRFGRLNALRTGLVINLVGLFISLIACEINNFQLLLTSRLITALGAASGLTCCIILINELLEPEQAKAALSYVLVSFTLSIAVAVAIGGFMAQYSSWIHTFWFLILHGVVMLASTWLFSETLKTPQSIQPLNVIKNYLSALKNLKLVMFSIIIGFTSSIAYSYSAAAPLIAHDILQLKPSGYGTWNLLNTLGMFLGGFAAAEIMKYINPKKLIIMSLAFILLCIASLVHFQLTHSINNFWFFASTCSMFFFSSFIFPAASFLATNAIPDKANASGMTSFLNMGSAMLSVIILGYLPFVHLWSFITLLLGYWLVAILLLVITLLLKQG
jgi:predicted MFS family arabinose efflux permease